VLNPRAGRENELAVKKTRKPKTVLVAGGGPAGMEFALTAALRGHRVTLYEKENTLGGQVRLAMAPPRKGELGNITESLKSRMEKAGVRVKPGTALTARTVKKLKPDVVAVATGALPVDIPVPGAGLPHVVSAWDVLMEKVPNIGKEVVIVGANATGCETAHYIASLGAPEPEVVAFLMYHSAEDAEKADKLLHSSGRAITVIDMAEKIAGNVGKTSRWSLLKSLRLSGVVMSPKTRLLEITDTEVLVETTRGRRSIPASTVVMAVGSRPENTLAKELEGSGVTVVTLGDALSPRKITDAVREGFEQALKI